MNRFDWPDFVWAPYRQFTSGLTQPLGAVALGYAGAFRPDLTQELHAGWSRNTVRWDREHPEIPTIAVGQPAGQPPLSVPGSPLLYGLRDTARNYQLTDSWSWVRSRHIARFGAGFLLRSLDSIMTIGRDGEVTFPSMNFFLFDRPNQLFGRSRPIVAAASAAGLRAQLPKQAVLFLARIPGKWAAWC